MKKILLTFALFIVAIAMTGCGGGTGASSTPAGVNPSVASVVKLMPVQSMAQTNSYVFLKAKVLDGNGNLLPGVPVTFTNLSLVGSLSAKTVTTDRLGMATVSLYSTTSGFSTVQAEVNTGAGQVRDKRTVFFSDYEIVVTPTPVPTPALTLEVDGNNNGIYNEQSDLTLFQTSNDNQVLVRATVMVGDVPQPNLLVTFGADSTDATFPAGNTSHTNADGQAFVTMTVDPSFLTSLSNVINITAVADDGAANVLSLTLEPVIINTISMYADPQSVKSGGTSSITAMLQTTAGGIVPNGTTVNFSADSGTITPFSQTTDGSASATFTAPTLEADSGNQVVVVTGSSGGRTGHVNVTVIAPVSSPTPTPTPAGLTVIPATVSVDGNAGGTATFTILNGTAPYIVTSADPLNAYNSGVGDGVWNVANSGDSITVTVPAGAPTKTVTLTVTDSVAATKTMTVSIVTATPTPTPTPSALTVIPSTVSVAGSIGGTPTLTIYGGVPPYTVSSSNPLEAYNGTPGTGLWNVASSGGTFDVTVPPGTPEDTVTLTVDDSAAGSVDVTLNIVSGNLTLVVAPPNQVLNDPATSDYADYTISGGTQPYTVTTDRPDLVTVSYPNSPDTSTAELTVNNVPSVTTTVNITVTDHYGSMGTATLQLVEPVLAVTPTTVSVPSGTESPTFTITGGTPPYTVTSSNTGVITSPGNLGGVVNTFTVTPASVGSDTPVTLTITDSSTPTHLQTTATVTVTYVSLAIGFDTINVVGTSDSTDTVHFTVTGGVPPYIVTSDHPELTPDGTWSLSAAGTTAVDPNPVPGPSPVPVVFTVVDNVGASAFTTLTIYPQTTSLSITVDKLSVIALPGSNGSGSDTAADDITMTVSGGTAPYTVSASSYNTWFDPAGPWDIATDGGTQKIDPITAVADSTPVTLTVTDAHGATAQVIVTLLP